MRFYLGLIVCLLFVAGCEDPPVITVVPATIAEFEEKPYKEIKGNWIGRWGPRSNTTFFYITVTFYEKDGELEGFIVRGEGSNIRRFELSDIKAGEDTIHAKYKTLLSVSPDGGDLLDAVAHAGERAAETEDKGHEVVLYRCDNERMQLYDLNLDDGDWEGEKGRYFRR
jgi:hypothetical protein